MSILIRGIDMPSKVDLEFSDNYILLGGVLHPIEIDQLVYIPTPHGRLIDRDDIYIGRWDIDSDLAEQIQNAPTILEAEE